MSEPAVHNTEIKKLVQSKTFDMSQTPAVLRTQLEAIAAVVKDARGKARTFWLVGVPSAIGTCIALALGQSVPVIGGLGAVGIGAIIAASMFQRSITKFERYDLASKLLELAERDSDPNTPIHLKLSFAGLANSATQVKDAAIARRQDRRYYRSEWLKMQGRFLDGTSYRISVTESLHIKNRKGKQKPKGYKLVLILAYPQKRYGGAENLAKQAQRAIQLPAGMHVKKLQVTARNFVLAVKVPAMSVASTGEQISEHLYKAIAMMLLSGYEMLNAARSIQKASGG